MTRSVLHFWVSSVRIGAERNGTKEQYISLLAFSFVYLKHIILHAHCSLLVASRVIIHS